MSTVPGVADAPAGVVIPLVEIRGSSLWRDALRRLLRNRLAILGAVVVLFLILLALFADFIAPYAYTKTNFGRLIEAPSRDYPLGTDQLGRDLLSRMIYGARVSMLGAGLTNIFIAIGLTGWVGIARQTRAQVLAIKQKEFVEGARALGSRAGRLLFRHVLPNALTPIVVAVTFGIPEAIFTEAALSFIGVGINPPTPSWGQMVGEGQQYIRSYWHLCVFPSIAIAVTMLAFTFFGDGVRDALDPKMK